MKKKYNKLPLLYLGLILLVALPLSIIAVQSQTFTRQEAAEEVDVNSAAEIASTNNPDDTMGPQTVTENLSSQLPDSEKGKLDVETTDFFKANGQDTTTQEDANEAEESGDTQNSEDPQSSQTTHGKSADHAKNNKGHGKSKLQFTAIMLTITKAEVHLAKLAGDTSPDEADNAQEDTTHADTNTRPSAMPSHVVPSRTTENTQTTTTHGKGKGKVKGDATSSAQIPTSKKGHWETLNITAPLTVDLVELATNGDIKSLGLTDLAAGRYTEIRLYVSSASATLADGTTVTLDIPGKNHIVRIVKPFTVVAGQTTNLLISVNSKKSVIKAGNRYMLKPVIARMLVNKPQGSGEEENGTEE